jgi:transposase
MSKTFRSWDVDQAWLLPPSLHDFVPAGHPAHFVREMVRESLDLSAILMDYPEERGQPPYHPAMMTALLLYAYSRGVYSSRKIARACEERLDFMAVTGLQKPDFRTISDFRKRHLRALSGLFAQVLALCRRAGLVKLGHVALDGTKIKANASKHKAMSYARMVKAEAELGAEVEAWLTQAEAADTAEDGEFGAAARGDEMPDWVANKQQRLAKIKQAKAALEAEAKAAAEAAREEQEQAPKRPGGKPKPPSAVPADKAQRNFTDPDSRILKTKDGFVQGYNAQAAVDAGHQIIVAHGLTNSTSDQGQLEPMVAAIEAAAGARPKELSADAGYCSEDNLKVLEALEIRGYIATGRQKHGAAAAVGPRAAPPGSLRAAMATRLKRGGRRSRYRLRKITVEPVFGQTKQGRGFRQFLLRGLDKVASEWGLVCTAHNLTKLAAAAA